MEAFYERCLIKHNSNIKIPQNHLLFIKRTLDFKNKSNDLMKIGSEKLSS